jgi:hypothetical protein
MSKERRRWLTFSLKSLFLLILIVAAYFAGWRSARWTAERGKEAARRKLREIIRSRDESIAASLARSGIVPVNSPMKELLEQRRILQEELATRKASAVEQANPRRNP